MSYFVIIFVLAIIISALYFYLTNINGNYWKIRNVPYVGKKTPLGAVYELIVNKKPLPLVYKEIYEAYPQYSHVGLFLGGRPALLLRNLEDIQAVLTSEFQNFNSRGIPVNPNDILTDSIVFMNDYARWKLLRQKLSPVFTKAKLKNMFYIIERCAKDFVEFLDKANHTTDNINLLYTYSTASIGAAVFGIDTKTKNTMDSPFLEMAKTAVSPTLRASFNILIGNISQTVQKFINISQFGEIEDFFVGVVKNVLSSRRTSVQQRFDFIDTCLELQSHGTMRDPQTGYEIEPTDEVMAAQAFFFFVAGSDTSANAMHFTLFELSKNPDILAKVHKEIDEYFSDGKENFNYDDLETLVYLDMVLSESLRKYPPAGLLQRKCAKDTVLPFSKVKIEKDRVVLVPTYALHKDSKYFPDPEKFDPERFSPENIGKITKFTYLPFGEGNRMCIGARFARLQVLSGLACLLRRYTLEPGTEGPVIFEPSFFALRTADIKYNFLKRNN